MSGDESGHSGWKESRESFLAFRMIPMKDSFSESAPVPLGSPEEGSPVAAVGKILLGLVLSAVVLEMVAPNFHSLKAKQQSMH